MTLRMSLDRFSGKSVGGRNEVGHPAVLFKGHTSLVPLTRSTDALRRTRAQYPKEKEEQEEPNQTPTSPRPSKTGGTNR